MSGISQPLVQTGSTRVEETFLNEGGVLVTNARFNVPGQMYAMANVSSVGTRVEPAKRGWAIFWVLVGLAAIVIYIGVVPLLIGIVMLLTAKAQYHVVLRSSGGETQALTSTDRAFIERVVAALGNAIISRG